MPVQPHPITITVYDTDNTTLKSGACAYVRNCTKKTTSSIETTNASGVAVIDLANLPLATGQTEEYSTGDKILIISYNGQNHDAAMYTVTGTSKSQTLYLNPIVHTGGGSSEYGDTVRLMQILTGNTDGSNAYYIKVWAIDDGELLAHIETDSNSSQNVIFGSKGKGCSGGFVVERENKAVIVTATFK